MRLELHSVVQWFLYISFVQASCSYMDRVWY